MKLVVRLPERFRVSWNPGGWWQARWADAGWIAFPKRERFTLVPRLYRLRPSRPLRPFVPANSFARRVRHAFARSTKTMSHMRHHFGRWLAVRGGCVGFELPYFPVLHLIILD